MSKHARKRRLSPRMNLRSCDLRTVARNHYYRVGYRGTHRLFRNREDHHAPAFFPVFRKSFRCQPLACLHPSNILVRNSLPLLPTLIENRGLQARASRRVGITLRGHIQSATSGSLHHSNQNRCVPQPHASDVNDMQRRSRRSGVCNHFLQSNQTRRRLFQSCMSQVHVHRSFRRRRNSKHAQNLIVRRCCRVVDSHAHRKRAAC